MKAEEVYLDLTPSVVSTEMIEVAEEIAPSNNPELIAETCLKVAQDYFNWGAFDMEHKDGVICMAEDQAGYSCCKHPAQYFVKTEYLKRDDKRQVYCRMHYEENRFYPKRAMAPIYENPEE